MKRDVYKNESFKNREREKDQFKQSGCYCKNERGGGGERRERRNKKRKKRKEYVSFFFYFSSSLLPPVLFLFKNWQIQDAERGES